MDARLRDWATTGHYTDGEEPSLDGPRSSRGASIRGVTPMVALLIPVGIACGALLAVACVARLILLPLTGRRGSP
jgi:hypothetical protein